MDKILIIALNDLRVFFAQRSNWISLLVLPVVFSLLLGWAFSRDNGPTQQRVDLLDLDQSELSTKLVAELLQANPTLLLCPAGSDPEDACRLEGEGLSETLAIDRVRRGRTVAFIRIPKGYAQVMSDNQPVQIDFYSTDDPAFPNPVQRTIDAVLQRTNGATLAAGVAEALLNAVAPAERAPFFSPQLRQQFRVAVFENTANTLVEQPPVVRYFTTKAEVDQRQANGFNQSVPGMGAMYTMFTVLAGLATLWRERRQWTLQRLVVLPITRVQLLAGKIGATVTRGVVQFLIVFLVGYFVGVDFGQSPFALLAVVIAFVLCVTALTFVLAPHITSEGQAEGLSMLLGLTLAPLGGAWWPLEVVPSFMRTIGHLSPVAWAMDAFHQLIFDNAGFAAVLPEIGVLTGSALILFAVAVRTFRYE